VLLLKRTRLLRGHLLLVPEKVLAERLENIFLLLVGEFHHVKKSRSNFIRKREKEEEVMKAISRSPVQNARAEHAQEDHVDVEDRSQLSVSATAFASS
jgi:hypothetical protein